MQSNAQNSFKKYILCLIYCRYVNFSKEIKNNFCRPSWNIMISALECNHSYQRQPTSHIQALLPTDLFCLWLSLILPSLLFISSSCSDFCTLNTLVVPLTNIERRSSLNRTRWRATTSQCWNESTASYVILSASPPVRGGRVAAPFSCGPRETAAAAETTAPATDTPTPSTPSPSPARQRADASRGTWKNARPLWPQPTAAGRTTTERL